MEWLSSRTQVWIDLCARQARPLGDADLDWVQSLLPANLDDVAPTYIHHDLKPANCVFLDGEVSGLLDLGEGTTGDPLEDLARPTWDLALHDPTLVPVFLRSYEEASGIRVPLDRLWAYVVLDLIVVWEYGTRPAQSWFSEPTFAAWASTFASPVALALELLAEDE